MRRTFVIAHETATPTLSLLCHFNLLVQIRAAQALIRLGILCYAACNPPNDKADKISYRFVVALPDLRLRTQILLRASRTS